MGFLILLNHHLIPTFNSPEIILIYKDTLVLF
jgi:hypothetical protein